MSNESLKSLFRNDGAARKSQNHLHELGKTMFNQKSSGLNEPMTKGDNAAHGNINKFMNPTQAMINENSIPPRMMKHGVSNGIVAKYAGVAARKKALGF